MVQPNLLNPILVYLQQIDEDRTQYSNSRREPRNRVKRDTSFSVDAQLFFGMEEHDNRARGIKINERDLAGEVLVTDGYIVVRKVDLVTAGKTLNNGDKLVGYGFPETSCEYFLVGKKEAAHYSDIGNFTLEKWYFQDRS